MNWIAHIVFLLAGYGLGSICFDVFRLIVNFRKAKSLQKKDEALDIDIDGY